MFPDHTEHLIQETIDNSVWGNANVRSCPYCICSRWTDTHEIEMPGLGLMQILEIGKMVAAEGSLEKKITHIIANTGIYSFIDHCTSLWQALCWRQESAFPEGAPTKSVDFYKHFFPVWLCFWSCGSKFRYHPTSLSTFPNLRIRCLLQEGVSAWEKPCESSAALGGRITTSLNALAKVFPQ